MAYAVTALRPKPASRSASAANEPRSTTAVAIGNAYEAANGPSHCSSSRRRAIAAAPPHTATMICKRRTRLGR
jgi:hypothetical protein